MGQKGFLEQVRFGLGFGDEFTVLVTGVVSTVNSIDKTIKYLMMRTT